MTDEARSEEGLPRWKKALLIVAGVFLAIGGILYATGSGTDPEPPTGGGGVASSLNNSLVPGATGSGGTSEANEPEGNLSDWSPFFLKGGFSLFFGFAIGYALRTFFKLSLVFVGLFLLFLLGLEYLGVVDIHMDAFEGLYDKAAAKIRSEAEAFQSFVTGSLPSAGIGTLGLFAGFKKG